MPLRNWPLFRSGIFKQAKYLVSSPEKAQSSLEILETGVVGIEPLPMQTGFMKATMPEVKKAWANVHALKYQIYKDGQPTDNESVLVISERHYIPLDPLRILKPKERERLASLKDIAKVRHAQARAAASSMDSHKDIAILIIQICGLLLGLYAIVGMVRGC